MSDQIQTSCALRPLMIFLAAIPTLCSGCAPQGYAYEVGSFVPHAKDACARPETSQTIVRFLNAKVGQPDGPVAPVISIQLITTENGAIDGPTLTCRGVLQTASGVIGPGVVVVRYRYDNRDLPADVNWETDADRHRADVAFRNPVPYVPSSRSNPANHVAANANRKQPKWIKTSQINNLTNYIDVDNIDRNGNFVTIWHLQDFNNPAGPDGKPIAVGGPGREFLSVKFQLEFDCRSKLDRLLYYATFSGHMGSGVLVDGGMHSDPWKAVADGELEDRRFSCDIVY